MFFALSLFAWAIWLPQAMRQYGVISWAPSFQSPLNALTVWAPGLAAIFLTAWSCGKAGVGALFRSLATWRIPAWWYVIALFLEPARWLTAFGVDRLFGQTYQLSQVPLFALYGSAAPFMVPVALVFTVPNSLGEELGWRAYALPRLQTKYGALVATLVLGAFWGVWHVPMWVAWQAVDLSPVPIIIKSAHIIPVAAIFTWLFNRSGGSLLLVCLFHASMAAKGYLLPKLPTPTELVLLWSLAAVIAITGGLNPSKAGGSNK